MPGDFLYFMLHIQIVMMFFLQFFVQPWGSFAPNAQGPLTSQPPQAALQRPQEITSSVPLQPVPVDPKLSGRKELPAVSILLTSYFMSLIITFILNSSISVECCAEPFYCNLFTSTCAISSLANRSSSWDGIWPSITKCRGISCANSHPVQVKCALLSYIVLLIYKILTSKYGLILQSMPSFPQPPRSTNPFDLTNEPTIVHASSVCCSTALSKFILPISFRPSLVLCGTSANKTLMSMELYMVC